MPDPTVAALHEWLKSHETDLLVQTQDMLRIPSLKEPGSDNAPFGQGNRKALDLALSIAESWGMRTKDLDGYAGYAEFGSGEPLIVVLGHLDVVPVSKDWSYDPFGATIDGDYIYARGAVDDKGPTMAAFFAARAIQEMAPNIPARIRIVFGCDEESGMACVKRYNETEEAPTFGIAPDSSWPLIHGEKGIADLHIEVEVPKCDLEVIALEGGTRLNVVMEECTATARIAETHKDVVAGVIRTYWDKNMAFSWQGEELLEIRARGKGAHGSTPFLGDSAATRLFRFLYEIAPVGFEKHFARLLESTHPSGVGVGIHGNDEPSGDLTANLGIISLTDGKIELAINVRYPVTWQFADLRSRSETYLSEKWPMEAKIVSHSDSPALYFPLDHPLVKTIVEVYREETGDMTEPDVMGGGTYARKIANTVSIGTGWAGDGRAHENNERLKVEHLYKMSRIYAHILWRLVQLAAK